MRDTDFERESEARMTESWKARLRGCRWPECDCYAPGAPRECRVTAPIPQPAAATLAPLDLEAIRAELALADVIVRDRTVVLRHEKVSRALQRAGLLLEEVERLQKGRDRLRRPATAAEAEEEYARRNDRDRLTVGERSILYAMRAVEAMPADERLTQAMVLLEDALRCIAAYMDDVRRKMETKDDHGPACHDCRRPYGDEHGFPDLVLPNDVWAKISPSGDENGLLCPSCIVRRCVAAGITCEARWRSGPFADAEMDAEAERDRLEDALEWAAQIFDNYAAMHERKNTPDGRRKAAGNRAHAATCRAALASAPADEVD